MHDVRKLDHEVSIHTIANIDTLSNGDTFKANKIGIFEGSHESKRI